MRFLSNVAGTVDTAERGNRRSSPDQYGTVGGIEYDEWVYVCPGLEIDLVPADNGCILDRRAGKTRTLMWYVLVELWCQRSNEVPHLAEPAPRDNCCSGAIGYEGIEIQRTVYKSGGLSRFPDANGADRAVTLVSALEAGSRREEIARMLSGASITEEARAQAERLMARAG